MSHQVLEGEWEEILQHGEELTGKRVRLIVIDDEETASPNETMLAAMQAVAVIQDGMSPTPGEDSEQLLREARDGKMYGLNSGK
jgi:hypothetical protein